jgi:hypothetical protein
MGQHRKRRSDKALPLGHFGHARQRFDIKLNE